MPLVALGELRTQARNRSDMRINGIFTDADFNSAINAGISELYDQQVKCWGDTYFLSSSIVPLQASATQAPLPRLYKLVGVDWQTSPGQPWTTLHSFEFNDRNKLSNQNQQIGSRGTNTRYCLYGPSLGLLPAPSTSTQQLQIWYVPQPTPLVNDTDSYDFQAGWQEYPILFAAIRALTAEESDTSAFERQLMLMQARIEDMAPKRDASEPHRMVDVESFCDGLW